MRDYALKVRFIDELHKRKWSNFSKDPGFKNYQVIWHNYDLSPATFRDVKWSQFKEPQDGHKIIWIEIKIPKKDHDRHGEYFL